MELRIITTEKEAINTKVSSVKCPGVLGELEILPGHAGLVSILTAGAIHYSGPSSGKHNLKSGLVSVKDDMVTILVGE